ncbi:CPCC family cysteine-rich protein [Streptomyces sp. CB03234]|uniref:CPCC family cysteine-rich protein n=1 Tax=Streptomyces sp. (strain CB03234) TaxID=1703937 RepID=UPI0009A236F2
MSDRYPCPCCGHRALGEMPGSYEICPVCFWEDDGVQFRWPAMSGGANRVSLIEAQRNYKDFGACDQHGRRYVRPPAEDEPLDPTWRPIDLTRDCFEDWAPRGPTTARCSAGGSSPSGAATTWCHDHPHRETHPAARRLDRLVVRRPRRTDLDRR